ncbi:MAG: porin [Planctomycetia bacterium]
MEDPAGNSKRRSLRRPLASGTPPRCARRGRAAGLTALLAALVAIGCPVSGIAGPPPAAEPRRPFGIAGVAEGMVEPLPPPPSPAPSSQSPSPPADEERPLIPSPPIWEGSGDEIAAVRFGDDPLHGDEPTTASVRIGGLVQLDDTAYAASAGPMQPIDRAGLAPPLSDAVNFRRARLRVDGRRGDQFDWAAEYDFANQINANNQIDPLWPSLGPYPALTDLWLRMSDVPLLGAVRVGNQKDPFGYEHLSSCRYLDFMERSFCQDAFVGPFNDGFVPGISARNGTADGLLGWEAGEFVNTAAPFGFSDFAGGSMTSGRAVWVPTYEDDGRRLLHIGLAGRTMQPRNGLVRFRSRGGLWNGPPGPDNAIYADSGVLAGSWQNMLGTELVANAGPWSMQAEYFGSWLYDAATTDIGPLSTAGWQPPPGTPVGTVFYQGGYVETTYFLTGESRTYSLVEHRFDRPQPRHLLALSPHRPRGLGAWQAAARYNYLCLNDGQVNGGLLNGMTLGLNWLLTPNARIVFNYDLTHREYRSTPWANGPSGPVPVPSSNGSGTIHGFGSRLAFDF